MLTHIPDNNVAIATKTIRDITERQPIPRGSVVSVEDFDPCGDSGGLFVVEHRSKIYLATPDELGLGGGGNIGTDDLIQPQRTGDMGF